MLKPLKKQINTKSKEWFKGRPTKKEIDKALTTNLNDDNPDEPPPRITAKQIVDPNAKTKTIAVVVKEIIVCNYL